MENCLTDPTWPSVFALLFFVAMSVLIYFIIKDFPKNLNTAKRDEDERD